MRISDWSSDVCSSDLCKVKHLQRGLIAHDCTIDDLRRLALDRHREMAEAEQHAAEQNRLAHAEPAVGDHATEHRRRVDKTAVRADQVIAQIIGERSEEQTSEIP